MKRLFKNITQEEEQNLLIDIIDNSLEPIFCTKDENIIYANSSLFELANVDNIDLLNDTFKHYTQIFKIGKNKSNKQFKIKEIDLSLNNGKLFILKDISYKDKYKKYLNTLIYTDSLTELPNRKALIDNLQNKNCKIKTIALVDIKSFKEINDFFGHKLGDYILKEVANLLKGFTNLFDYIELYKFPADVYCITCNGNDQKIFESLIQKIIQTIYNKVFVYEQNEVDLRITVGISFSNKNNKLVTADIALQTAKKENKNYVIFYDELDNLKEYENNMIWTKKIKYALSNDSIEVFFQPLINNKTLKVEKYECLVRLIDNGKIISPFFFLDISKKSNQYKQITKIVIEKSFQAFEDLPYDFSLNISYEDIESSGFLNFVKKMLNTYNVSNRVIFEILENENIKNYDLLINFIDEVKKLGCKVAIDDFGSGYSNFEHILKMNIDYLKIDASIIKNISYNNSSYKITKTIIDFANNLGLKTIAEFVENEEIFNLVKNLGSDYSQGYFFSPPIEKSKIENIKN